MNKNYQTPKIAIVLLSQSDFIMKSINGEALIKDQQTDGLFDIGGQQL